MYTLVARFTITYSIIIKQNIIYPNFMKINKIICSFIFCLSFFKGEAQQEKINLRLLSETWDANWITSSGSKNQSNNYGVFLFRKNFDLNKQPQDFIIHVSADNRYEFFVNEKYIGSGPARSVPEHWNFETYNIASYLKTGRNTLAVKVWNWGKYLPWAQTTLRTALLVQGNTANQHIANTNASWKVREEKAYTFFNYTEDEFHHSTGIGPCEKIDGNEMLWDWNSINFDDSQWVEAKNLMKALPCKLAAKDTTTWGLTPRNIPQMDKQIVRLDHIVRSKGIEVGNDFCKGNASFTVPADSKAVILFDNKTLTVVHPQLEVTGGKGTKIKLIYSEALYNDQSQKTYRDSLQGMQIKGYYDIFLPDGKNRTFQPLWNRTYRFVQMEITTGKNPLTVKNYQGLSDVFPFELKADFKSSDPYLEKIFKVGWRTGRMCALENYVDCPYYEQLQYFGDLNVSNPITVLLSGDTRLVKSAILQGKYSIADENLTKCAAPARGAKIIPFFSVAWIGMIHNYWMYTADKEFVEKLVPEIEGIMQWYKSKLNNQSMLGPMPHWNFVDCTEAWPWAPEKNSICEPIGTKEGNSSILTLQFVYGLQITSKMFNQLGMYEKATEYQNSAKKIKKAVYEACWDETKQLIADVPDKTSFSQHANIFAALTGTIPDKQVDDVLLNLYKRTDVICASTQFQAYFHQALVKYGLGDKYLTHLNIWKKMIDWGFTTFPEYPELNNRSDCHAWNAYPAYEFFTIICGIQNVAPGFTKAVIAPHPGNLQWIEASLPWKKDKITVKMEQKAGEYIWNIYIPKGLETTFRWKKQERTLHAGTNTLKLKK